MSNAEASPDAISIGRANGPSQFLESYEEVAAFLGKRVSEFFMLGKRFRPEVVGGLVVADSVQYLRLVGEQKVGIVRRHMSGTYEGGVAVSTQPLVGVDVIANIEPIDSELFDRGLAWVHVIDEGSPLYKIGINREHGVEEAEIVERLRAAEARTVQMVRAILESDPEPPYAQQYVPETVN